MQILHLKTRIKRENSILPRHLTAVKVGVIYCSGGVTAVYCTTPVHSTPSCGRAEGVAQYAVCHLRLVKLMFLSCGHLAIMCHHNPTYLQPPAECSLVTTWALAWAGNAPCWRGQHTLAGGHWRLGWEAASQESEQWSDLATFLAPEVITPSPSPTSGVAVWIYVRNFGWLPLESCLVFHQYQVRYDF